MTSSCSGRPSLHKLENIEEDSPASWLPMICPETPTETMEFLARSWSLSAMEVSRALSDTHAAPYLLEKTALDFSTGADGIDTESATSKETLPSYEGEDIKELFLLHQALNPEIVTNQQLLKNGLYKTVLKGHNTRSWLKDQKERKKQECRTKNAQLHAAVTVAGVAAAVAALAAATVTPTSEVTGAKHKAPSKMSATIASAAALVASHCIEIAEDMGADHDQILTVVNSAVNARTTGDIMTLTASAATALRGAATLRARMHTGPGAGTISFPDEKVEGDKDSGIVNALSFASQGQELLKRTRKGALHWKQLSFSVKPNWQVVAKMKSKYMAGTFTKKKECITLPSNMNLLTFVRHFIYAAIVGIVHGVCSDMPAWPGREREGCTEQRAYFGIKTADRIIEFECTNQSDRDMWTEGILHLLQCRESII